MGAGEVVRDSQVVGFEQRWKVELIKCLDIWCERKSRIKDDSKVSSLTGRVEGGGRDKLVRGRSGILFGLCH